MDRRMSSTYAEPLDLVERGLDELATIDPGYRTAGEKQEVLLRLLRVISRAEGERFECWLPRTTSPRRPVTGPPLLGWQPKPGTTTGPYAGRRRWLRR